MIPTRGHASRRRAPRVVRGLLALLLAGTAFRPGSGFGSEPGSIPLDEVVRTLKATVPVPDPAPGTTNVAAYLDQLAPTVLPAPTPATSETPVLKTAVYPAGSPAGYLRLGPITGESAKALESSLAALERTQALASVVIDLRHSSGTDLAAAGATAAVLARDAAQYQVGSTRVDIPAGSGARRPVMVLVSSRTRGSAEVLAAALRRTVRPCLVLGSTTAGQARTYRPLTLGPGLDVRVGGDPVTFPDAVGWTNGRVVPDLVVAVDAIDEQAYLTNEFVRVTQGRPAIPAATIRLNEAELVRRRGGPALRNPHAAPDESSGGGRRLGRPARTEETDAPAPSVQDPVLARALDCLSGLLQETAPAEPGSDSR